LPISGIGKMSPRTRARMIQLASQARAMTVDEQRQRKDAWDAEGRGEGRTEDSEGFAHGRLGVGGKSV